VTTVTVKLPDPLSRALAREAKARGVPKSEVIRSSLQQHLADKGGDDQGPSCLDLAADLVGIFDGPKDASSNPKHLNEAIEISSTIAAIAVR
jgi:Ribbon-helix-helix protein, copG family